MVNSTSTTFSDPRLLAGLFSNASLRGLCQPVSNSNSFIDSLQSMLTVPAEGQTLRSLLDLGYQELLQNYRHEYIFKSALFKDFILKKYALDSSILLSEFKIGKSIADAVLVNGTNKVFEIKTELDSPFRLDSQIEDYKKAFSEVYLVVHERQVEKYLGVISAEIGLLTFSEGKEFLEAKKSKPDTSQLEIGAMVKSLRKDELSLLVTQLTGEVPVATPVKLFTTCLETVQNFSPTQVQKEYLQIIKGRINPSVNTKVLCDQIPPWLKFFCYSENIKEKNYIHLLNSLDITL